MREEVVHTGRSHRVSQALERHPAVTERELKLLACERISGGQARAIAYGAKARSGINVGHEFPPDSSVSAPIIAGLDRAYTASSMASTMSFIWPSCMAPSHRWKMSPSAPKNTVVGMLTTV